MHPIIRSPRCANRKKLRECDPAHIMATEWGRIFEQGRLPAADRRRARYGGRHFESNPMQQKRVAGRDRPAGARRPPSPRVD